MAGTVEGDGMWTAIAELLFPSSVFSDTVSERPSASYSCLRGQMRGEWNVYCRRGAAIPLFCPQRYGLRAELQLDHQWRPTLRERRCDA